MARLEHQDDSLVWALVDASPEGLSEAKILQDKLASWQGDTDTLCASTGQDARHRYLIPWVIMQAVKGAL